MDAQFAIGAIAAGLALGMIAHEHGFLAYVRRHLRLRRWPAHPVRVTFSKQLRRQIKIQSA
jgi:hypothetical protein